MGPPRKKFWKHWCTQLGRKNKQAVTITDKGSVCLTLKDPLNLG